MDEGKVKVFLDLVSITGLNPEEIKVCNMLHGKDFAADTDSTCKKCF